MSSGRERVARELCGDEAERLTGLIEGGEVRRCGFDGGLSSPVSGRSGGAFWGMEARSKRKREGNGFLGFL